MFIFFAASSVLLSIFTKEQQQTRTKWGGLPDVAIAKVLQALVLKKKLQFHF